MVAKRRTHDLVVLACKEYPSDAQVTICREYSLERKCRERVCTDFRKICLPPQ